MMNNFPKIKNFKKINKIRLILTLRDKYKIYIYFKIIH